MKTIQSIDSLKNLEYAATVSEKISWLQEYLCNDEEQNNLISKWRSRKTLVNDQSFQAKLEYENVTLREFATGIASLTQEKQIVVKEKQKEQEWHQFLNEIINEYREEEILKEQIDFTYALRPFLQYIKDQLKSFLEIYQRLTITDDAQIVTIGAFYKDCMNIIEKTLVLDMHNYKNNHRLEGKTSEERFKDYIYKRFHTIEDIKTFLSDYPALARILAERTMFFSKNLYSMIKNIVESYSSIQNLIHTCDPLVVSNINWGEGDSHDKGKSVAILEFNHIEKLVYKPKNLSIAQKFNQFLEWLNQNDSRFDFYISKRISKTGYNFEEFISYNTCTSEDEVQFFYKSFGQLIGIAYLLCGNDFHYENLIAHGKYPVLIDVETLFQHIPPLSLGSNAFTKAKFENLNSVLITGLVPFEVYGERDKKGNKGVQLSALNGDEQTIPYKVLKPTNIGSDEMAFEYQEHTITSAQNIPKLNDKKLVFQNYTDEIINGFNELCKFVLENKEECLKEIEDIFSNSLVRNVIKGTQRYSDMLQFSYHPSCMVNIQEREKVLENLWAYPYHNKEVVSHEINDLLVGDIPIFYNSINTTSLISSNGIEIKNVYDEPILTKVYRRINKLTNQEIEKQSAFLTVSMGLYNKCIPVKNSSNGIKEKIKFNDSNINKAALLEEAIKIGDELLANCIWSEDHKTITWNDIQMENEHDWMMNPLRVDLYDGLAGIYLFFIHLSRLTQEKRFIEILEPIKNTLYSQLVPNNIPSAFTGKTSLLYPLSVLYQVHKEQTLVDIAKEVTINFQQEIQSCNDDWLSGKAGLIKVITNWYRLTNENIFLEVAINLGELIDKKRMLTPKGLGHGLSGVALSLHALSRIVKTNSKEESWEEIAQKTLESETTNFALATNHLTIEQYASKEAHKLCKGSTGYGIALSHINNDNKMSEEQKSILLKILEVNGNHEKWDDGLCHGNSGDIELFISILENSALKSYHNETNKYLNEKLYNLIDRKKEYGEYRIRSLNSITSVGLFTGITGIGLTLLRVYDFSKVPSVVTLDLIKNT
ncbi:hypothetical protein C3744_27395 [Priestia megaterium]|uniref:Lantibiotic biosynthesis protein dehydration domain-containing protein n=1 Tax=Priestia megaterium TaxID=1404 RepID=A0A3D8WV71_PRIMG|nr:type 2 lanthipeptide synthetase LanM family protein [Priestia megaterium]MDH3169154.1 type 2 lanthipeptide synthetase LanM family protein [Priestia megaterium]MDH3169202.1 type 2 lanthipeptide synthetase LanM family protein [Priestia megaterium]RDZ07683.1 hypothetical protein C3744_27395 [Priestia megaterium]